MPGSRSALELDAFLAQYAHASLRAAGFRRSHHSYRLNTALGDHALVRFVGSPLPDTLGSFWVQVSVILEPDWDLHFFDAPQRRSFPKRPDELDATFYWAALPGAAPHPRWSYNALAERDQLGEELRGHPTIELIPAVRRLLDRQLACEEAREDAQIPGHLQSERTYRALLTDAGSSTELDEALVAAQQRNTDADRKFIQWAQMRLLDGPTWISSDLGSPAQNLPE